MSLLEVFSWWWTPRSFLNVPVNSKTTHAPPPLRLPHRANPRAFGSLKNFGQIPRYVGRLDGQMPLKSVKSPLFQKRLLKNFSMRKNRLFKCKYSKISYLTQPKYPKSWNTVLRRFVHFNKNCLFPECTFNRLFQRLSNAPTKQWTRERAKNYEILLLVTLTSVLTRMSMPDWASLILGHFGVGRWLVHKSEIFALTRHSQKQRFRMSTVNT